MGSRYMQAFFIFQSTLPMRGATRWLESGRTSMSYFNPHSPCGERLSAVADRLQLPIFQSTLPMRGATVRAIPLQLEQEDFNPHSPCGERHGGEGGEGGDDLFQSTLPMRGATVPTPRRCSYCHNFNPHSPCGERLPVRVLASSDDLISIHTPHAGSDGIRSYVYAVRLGTFQSTLPMRGATTGGEGWKPKGQFQSTLPMRGATMHRLARIGIGGYFNPHSPCGERQQI